MTRSQLLYVGGFRLPDRNAAAQRVVNNAKGLREAGFDVVLAELGSEDGHGGAIERLPDYEGFVCYRLPMKQNGRWDLPQLAIGQLVKLIDELDDPRAVIAYNYPSVALARLMRLARRRGMKVGVDVTEWYGTSHLSSSVAQIVKWVDTTVRMRVLQRRADVVIPISTHLEQVYSTRSTRGSVHRIPPLVDTSSALWSSLPKAGSGDALKLVYAGSPSAEKERLDATVAAASAAAAVRPLRLDVVGLTEEQFTQMYPGALVPDPSTVVFHGRVPHSEAVAKVAAADFSVVVRDRSRVTDAGFPTKFVESVSLGTPVISTPHPDLTALLADGRNGLLVTVDELEDALRTVDPADHSVDAQLFDVSRYRTTFDRLFVELGGTRG